MSVKMFDSQFASMMGLDKIPAPNNNRDQKMFNQVRERDPFVSFSARVEQNKEKQQ